MPKTASKPEKTVTTTKAAKIIDLLQRSNGATIAELAKCTSRQAHSVRGFISGKLKKEQGIQINSSQEDGKPRRYFINGGDR